MVTPRYLDDVKANVCVAMKHIVGSHMGSLVGDTQYFTFVRIEEHVPELFSGDCSDLLVVIWHHPKLRTDVHMQTYCCKRKINCTNKITIMVNGAKFNSQDSGSHFKKSTFKNSYWKKNPYILVTELGMGMEISNSCLKHNGVR